MSGRRSVSGDQFRHTLAQLVTGVTVVTVRDASGRPFGITVSAACALSLDPPMMLICIDHDAALHDLIADAGVVGVNVLADGQADVARRFADRERHAFAEPAAASPAGLPLIPGALAHIDLRRESVLKGGDHSIVTGIVEWSQAPGGAPLCYFRSDYTGIRR